MIIHKEQVNNITIISVGSVLQEEQVFGKVNLDTANSDLLFQSLTQEILKGNIFILLELQYVSYIYSYGLGLIIDLYKQVVSKGGIIKILSPSIFVQNIFNTLRINSYIQSVDNKEVAIKNFFS
ncbi:MAG: hypothetical protein A2Y40_05195 [Candidatus Margulisbacteria bacterium GWF2_35_9]|nr:MAG: hypothetical protein A2Y40_05195 [Candidatus Margulisbacteria bacterium GWF2_35_9]